MKPKATLRHFLAITGSSLMAISSASAQATSNTWDTDAAGNWTDPLNWTGDAAYAEGADNTATFGDFITADRVINLTSDITIGNITASDTSNNYTISGVNVLTLDRTSGVPTINVTTSSRTLSISSQISGNDGLAKSGAGALVLSGSNNYTGATSINAGTLTLSGASGALASTSIALSGGTFTLDNTTNNLGTRVSDSATVTVNGNSALRFTHAGAAATNYSETIDTLSLQSGFLTYTGSRAATSQTSNVLFNTLSRSGTATVNFAGTSLGVDARNTIKFGAGVTSGTDLGPWAVVNGADFATYDSTLGIKAAANTTFAVGSNSSTTNFNVTANITVNAALNPSYKTLLYTSGTGKTVAIGSNNVYVGGISSTATADILSGAGTVQTLNAGDALYVNVGGTALTISSAIRNYNAGGTASGLVKYGAGKLVISSVATNYTGTTNLNGGTLTFVGSGNTYALFPSPIVTSAGTTLEYAPTANAGSNATIDLNGTLTYNSTGAGRLMLLGGAVTVNSASIINISSGVLTSSLILEGGLKGSADITLNTSIAAVGLFLRNGATGNYSGTMTINGIASTGNGTGSGLAVGNNGTNVNLPNANLTLNGTLELGNSRTSQGWTNDNLPSGSTFQMNSLNGTGVVVGNMFTTSATRTISVGNNNGSGSFSGQIVNGVNNTLSFIKAGTGTQTLTGTNAYTGGTIINNGTLNVGVAISGSTSAIGSTSGQLTVNGGTLNMASFNVTVGNLTGSGGVISGTSGTRTLTIGQGDNGGGNYQGQISDGSGGTTALTKTGTGTITLSGTNAYAGLTTINAGTLVISNSSALGTTAGATTVNGSVNGTLGTTLELAGSALTIAENINLFATSSGGDKRARLYNNAALNHIINGNIDVTSDGSFAMISSNSSTGSITVNGDITGTMTNSATFILRGASSNVSNRVLGNVNLNGGTLTKVEAGTWLIGASGKTYSWGATNVAVATLKLGAANVLPSTTLVTMSAASTVNVGTLDLNGFSQTVAGIVLATSSTGTTSAITSSSGTPTLTVGDASDYAYAALLTGSLALTKQGTGTLTLSGINTYTGTTTVNAATLKLGANDVLPNASNVSIGTATLDADTRTDTAGTLDVTGGAVINLGSGAALAFADSKAVDWTGGTLNITGTLGATSLRFGDSADDLTSGPGGQLAKISVNGSGLGTYILDANGYLVAGGDTTPPTLTSITDNVSGGPTTVGTMVTYTVTFSEDMDASTVTAVDFNNAGTAGLTIGSVTETTPGVFIVQATPTSAGSLTLRIVGPILQDTSANNLVVPLSDDTTITIQTQYQAWAGGVIFDADANGDGVSNGLAFLLGASGPNVTVIQPTITQSGGNLVLSNFSSRNSASRGTATLSVQHSSDLGLGDPWTTVLVPEATAAESSGVSYDITPGDPLNTVNIATVSSTQAAGGKLFGRLKAEQP